jgi:UPF0716 protein FxsA
MIKFRHLLFLFLFPVVDLALLIRVQSVYMTRYMSGGLAFLTSIALCIITAIIGIKLAKREGIDLLYRLQESAMQEEGISTELFEALCISIGGLALFIPGYISDAIGILLLIPWLRRMLARILHRVYAPRVTSSLHYSQQGLWQDNGPRESRRKDERSDDTVIDVEPIE